MTYPSFATFEKYEEHVRKLASAEVSKSTFEKRTLMWIFGILISTGLVGGSFLEGQISRIDTVQNQHYEKIMEKIAIANGNIIRVQTKLESLGPIQATYLDR